MRQDAGELGSLRRAARFLVKEMGLAADRAIRAFAPGGRVPTRAGGTGTTQGAEPPLGVPLVDGYILSSTTAGVRSWVPQTEAVTTRWELLADGDLADPQFIFAGGDAIYVEVPL